MSSALKCLGIFQSAWLAPLPRLTSIAAVVLTLLTAPIANLPRVPVVTKTMTSCFLSCFRARSQGPEKMCLLPIKALCSKPGRVGELFGTPATAPTVIAAANQHVSYVRLRRCLV